MATLAGIMLLAVAVWFDRQNAERAEVMENTTFVRQAAMTFAQLKPFQNMNLKGANLSGLGFGCDRVRTLGTCAHLTGAQLTGADLTYVNLEGADLTFAELTGADLEGADLDGAKLGYADLSGAHLRDARLEGADLTNVNLEGAADHEDVHILFRKRHLWEGIPYAPQNVSTKLVSEADVVRALQAAAR